ncbi:helix-turn-helix domain-containing protein [Epilithonimonas sp.]|uniref:helix-turn-helix domain-containing protein n=1 Tax=Epilithonimonas sp. TaxID=2894511 RepID=UPI0035B11B2D
MKFEAHLPTEKLRPYIRQLVVSENASESEYKVFPSTGMVIGFQYRGTLSTVQDNTATRLTSAGITGIADRYRIFRNSAGIGTILVYFTETGFAHFATHPAHELFNLSLSLKDIFRKDDVSRVEDLLSDARNDQQRLHITEQFLLSQLKEREQDQLISEAVRLIYTSKGNIRIKDLNERLFISQSPFEKRFRKVVGISAKKFASIVRFNNVLSSMNGLKSLEEICYENGFFDQAHFIHNFKQYTGQTPEQFKRFI